MQQSFDISRLRYNTDLPIYAYRDRIVSAISGHRAVVITGETGCGKSTQLPLFCLEALRGAGRIAVTQPRRIAAVSLARRVAEELESEPGDIAGFRTRFDECVSGRTRIVFQTDGILVADIGRDRFFSRYGAVIIDEAHERNLNIDLIIGHLRWLLRKRPDLKVIVSSATINPEQFSRAFGDAPIVRIEGRTFPISIVYDPFDEERMNVQQAAVRAAGRIDDMGEEGDILVFLPTERDIIAVKRMLDGGKLAARVLPLFARLSRAHQDLIFRPSDKRKIVIATNIAETSLTVPGIRFVIDSGLARVKRYRPHARITALPVERISRAGADQRAGRCGRTREGVCIRLYGEEEYEAMEPFIPAEIARSNMAGVILTMIAHRLGAIERFAFIEPPPARSVADGFAHLRELGALDAENRLTSTGRRMSAYPVDPHLARVIVEGETRGALEELLIVVSALSCVDPRERPAEKAEAADLAHRRFGDPVSDFVWYLNVWRVYHDELRAGSSQTRMRAFCSSNYLSFVRMKEWRDVHAQLSSVAGLRRVTASATFETVHSSLLAGFIANIALRDDAAKEYKTSHGGAGVVFPGSGLAKKNAPWIMFAEKIETSRLFLRTVARIDPRWIADVAPHLVKRRYSDPCFDEERGDVRATEHKSVFGFTIEKVKVAYGRINPFEANEVFIREGLMERRARTHYSFLEHNRAAREAVAAFEAKLRVRDLDAGDEALYRFYKERLPDVVSVRDCEAKIRSGNGETFLKARPEDFLARPLPAEADLWPDRISLGGEFFPCTYRFDPGDPSDGMTLHLPAGGRPFISDETISWLVAPLWERRIAALFESAPREARKRLSPVRENSARCADKMKGGNGHFCAALAVLISKELGADIPPGVFLGADIPYHLWVHTAFDDGRPEALSALSRWRRAFDSWGRRPIDRWDFGDLPESVIVVDDAGGIPLRGYPAMADRGGVVDLIVCQDPHEAVRMHELGVARLVEKELAGELAWLEAGSVIDRTDRVWIAPFADADTLSNRAVEAVAGKFNVPPDPRTRSQEEFNGHIARSRRELSAAMRRYMSAIVESGKLLAKIGKDISSWKTKRSGPLHAPAIRELSNELAGYTNAIASGDTGYDVLIEFPRYLKRLAVSVARAMDDPARYARRMGSIRPYEDELRSMKNVPWPLKMECRAMLEEYKISLFAQQEVKAKPGVSEKSLADSFRKAAGIDA